MSDTRAVSDSLGFVLVFAIIISTVAVVFIGGFNSLDNARQYERMNNAERAFEVFADNVEDITQRGAPSRATEVKLADASLQSGPKQSIEYNVTNGGNRGNQTWFFRPIVYQSETDPTNKMIYEMGATFRASRSGTTMSTEPTWVISSQRMVIPIVQTVHDGGSNVTGSRTVLINTELSSSEVLVENTTGSAEVYLNVTSPRDDAWRRYMEDNGMTCKSSWQSSDVASCRLQGVDIVYVTYFQVNYAFE